MQGLETIGPCRRLVLIVPTTSAYDLGTHNRRSGVNMDSFSGTSSFCLSLFLFHSFSRLKFPRTSPKS